MRKPSAREVLGALTLLAVCLLAYWPAVHGEFLWDDDVHLTNNPAIVGSLGFSSIWTSSTAVYYPLTLTSFWAQYRLWGLNPFPYHVVNILMHATAALLLWRVLLQLKVPAAWFGAALWALHPVQTESVAWITELKNSQSLVFYLLAIRFFLLWIAGPRKPSWYALVLLCSMLAILSKTSTVMLPVVLGLCWWWHDRQWRWRNALWLAPFLLVAVAAGVWTIWEQQSHSGAIGPEWQQTPLERVAIAGRIVWFYLGKLLWPHPLIFVYPRWTVDSSRLVEYLPAAAVAIALLVLWSKRNGPLRPAFFAFAYFVLSLFPVSSFFNVYFFRYSFVSDHFQYLASIGPLALAATGIAVALNFIRSRQFLTPALCCVPLIVCGVLSARQSRIYASSVSLWTDTIAKNPNAWLAHTNLGADFDDQGKILEAASEYETSLRINPNDAKARNNLAIHLAELGRLPEAVEEWERALQFEPDNVSSHMNVAFALSQLGRFPEAFQHWERAIKLKPDLIDAHHSFGVALAQSGRWNEAIEQFMETTRLKPDYADAHYRLAVALKNAGRYDEAIARYRKTVELETHATAQNALAWILATCPKSSLRNGKEAVEWAEQAVERTRGQYPQTLDTLAAAYAEVGEFERAIKTARSALDLQAARENPALKEAIELRLKLYENRTPYHEN